jgi:uncharacterized alkaline shock family protein YloU
MAEDRKIDDRPAHPPPYAAVPDEHVDEESALGTIQIHNHVIATIARVTALKVPGVAALAGTLSDDLAGLVGRAGPERGVRVELADRGVLLQLTIVAQFGVGIPRVACQVQQDVREAVERMTGKSVKAVHVFVQGVQGPAPAPAPRKEQAP